MEKERYTSMGDSKLEFMNFENKPLYTSPEVKFLSNKFKCSVKKSIIIVVATLLAIFLIALTAALARGSCKAHGSNKGDLYNSPSSAFSLSKGEMYGTSGTDLFPGYLLPKVLTPLAYNITITPDWNPKGYKTIRITSFRGHVKLLFKALEPVKHLILNNRNLRFKSVTLRLIDEVLSLNEHSLTDIIYDDFRYEMVRINLSSKALIPEQTYVLDIEYTGNVSETTNGFYSSTYTDSNGQKYLLSTQFEPNYARRAFPCLDEPAYKAKFTIEIDRPNADQIIALSNMPLFQTRPITDPIGNLQLVRDQFSESVVMSTYLVAFVICDFKSVNQETQSKVKVGVYAPAEQIDQATFALDIAVKGLDFYERFFDIPFPLPKIDLIGIPDFSVGAMENWGLITYRMVDLLYKPNVTSVQTKERVAIVITHELAHQWFGNLVTMYWWDDLWLNEGFATYMEYVCSDAIFPDWGMAQIYWPDTAPNAFFLDAFEGSHPVSHSKVLTPGDMQSMFDAISYNKGSLLIGMLNGHIISRPQFKKGIHDYLMRHQYSNARSADLWAALQETASESNSKNSQFKVSSDKSSLVFSSPNVNAPLAEERKFSKTVNIRDLMGEWVTQKGFPVVHIMDPTKNQRSKNQLPADDYVIDVYQTKFRSQYSPALLTKARNEREEASMNSDKADDSVKWQIPLTLLIGRLGWTHDKDVQTIVWLRGGNISHSISSYLDGSTVDDVWIKGNLNYSGYYMVKYGPSLWNNLIKHLKTDASNIEPLDRSQLIDNTFSLARFGYMEYLEALNFSMYVNPKAFDSHNNNKVEGQQLNENDAMTLDVLLVNLGIVRNYFRLNGDNVPIDSNVFLTLMPAYVRKLVLNNLLKRFSDWKTGDQLSHLETNLQSRVIATAIAYGDEPTIQKARPYFEEWIHKYSQAKTYLPYPELADAILHAGIRYGNSSDWEMAWKAYKTSNVPSEKIAILQSLAYTNDRQLLDRLMSYVYNGIKTAHPAEEDYIRNQDILSVLSLMVSASPITDSRSLVWKFTKDNWNLLLNVFGDSSSTLTNLIRSVCKTFDTVDLRDDFDAFATKALETSNIPGDSISQTREIINLNVALLAKNANAITEWLKAHV